MWSYYGSKSKVVKHYPKPKYDLIIEPFAGAAWYSVFASDTPSSAHRGIPCHL